MYTGSVNLPLPSVRVAVREGTGPPPVLGRYWCVLGVVVEA